MALGLKEMLRRLREFPHAHAARSHLMDAIYQAATADDKAAVKTLLQRSQQEGNPQVGFWALNHALQEEHIGAVCILLDEGIRLPAWGGTPLMTAANKGNVELVRALLARGENVNETNSFGLSALMQAAAKGHTEVIELLLARGANVSLKTQKGHTASSYAQKGNHQDILKLLEEHLGAKP